jgi:hypothetical protein
MIIELVFIELPDNHSGIEQLVHIIFCQIMTYINRLTSQIILYWDSNGTQLRLKWDVLLFLQKMQTPCDCAMEPASIASVWDIRGRMLLELQEHRRTMFESIYYYKKTSKAAVQHPLLNRPLIVNALPLELQARILLYFGNNPPRRHPFPLFRLLHPSIGQGKKRPHKQRYVVLMESFLKFS